MTAPSATCTAITSTAPLPAAPCGLALGQVQADTIIPDPGSAQAYNRYSYVNNNPLRYIDPTGHDPLDPTWEQAFRDAHGGRDPVTFDRLIHLFSLAFPGEWDNSLFYDSEGNYIQGSVQQIFEKPPEGRTWDGIPDAIARLATYYENDEMEMLVRDIGFLFSGLKDRFEEPSFHKAVTDCDKGYICDGQGNLLYTPWVWVNEGSMPSRLTATDDPRENNIHHWAWALAVGYHRPLIGGWLNTGREFKQTKFFQTGETPFANPNNTADVLLGNWGVSAGGSFRFLRPDNIKIWRLNRLLP